MLFILSDWCQENDWGKLYLKVVENGLFDATAFELLVETDESDLVVSKKGFHCINAYFFLQTFGDIFL